VSAAPLRPVRGQRGALRTRATALLPILAAPDDSPPRTTKEVLP